MAITAVNPTYQNQGPAVSGQVFADNSASATEVAFIGEGTATLDGSSTSFTLNWIDGTNTLKFGGGSTGPTNAPTGVIGSVIGGTQTGYVGISFSAPTATGCTVNLSAAGTASNTVKFAFMILK